MWLKEDDRELGDPKVASLSDRDYRDLHALRQWLARERPGPGGLFTQDELVLMTYPTKKGARSVRKAALDEFLRLGLVVKSKSYRSQELVDMQKDGSPRASVEAALEILAADPEEMRCNRWEAYAAPIDTTRNERQKRHQAKKRGQEDNGVSNSVSNAGVTIVRARAFPVLQDQEQPQPQTLVGARRDETLANDSAANDDARSELADDLAVARLLGLLVFDNSAQADYVRGLASHSPAATVDDLTREVGAGVGYPLGYVLERLAQVAS